MVLPVKIVTYFYFSEASAVTNGSCGFYIIDLIVELSVFRKVL